MSSDLRTTLPAVELPPGEEMPRTAVQRYAARTLFAAGALIVVAAGVLAWYGPQAWWDTDGIRHAVTFLLLCALLVFLVFTKAVQALESRDDGSFDERDSIIMGRSSAGVGGAIMVVVAAWMVGLTEAHHETGLVPSYYLYLIFWSVVMTNVVASLAGILLAYRRS